MRGVASLGVFDPRTTGLDSQARLLGGRGDEGGGYLPAMPVMR